VKYPGGVCHVAGVCHKNGKWYVLQPQDKMALGPVTTWPTEEPAYPTKEAAMAACMLIYG
jgi:hypothetical protein